MTLIPCKFHLPKASSTKLPVSFSTTKPKFPPHLCFFNSNTNPYTKTNHRYTITPIPASEIAARDMVLDFGKFKGKMLGTLPSTYLRWVSKNLRARDFEEWARMADQVLQDPLYKDRLEWECAEKVLNGDVLTSFSHSTPSLPSSPVTALEEISERFGWDNEDKLGWSKVNFELLGTSKGGRIPRISKQEARIRLEQREKMGDRGKGMIEKEEDGKEERGVGVRGRRDERRDRVRLKNNGGGGMDIRSRSYDGEDRLEYKLMGRADEDEDDAGVSNRFPGREGLLKKVLRSKQMRRGTI